MIGKCEGFFIYPAPKQKRDFKIAPWYLDTALTRSYQSALDTFNNGHWDATVIACRKTLEGIVHRLDPSGKGALFQRLEGLFSSQVVIDPLRRLTNALRTSGNAAAHFSDDHANDEASAGAVLDLLEFFLEFAFELPQEAKAIENKMSKASSVP